MLSAKKAGSLVCKAVMVLLVMGIILSGNVEAQTYQFVTKWGSQGPGDGEFNYPVGVAMDSSGNVYVADSENHRLQKFDANGGFVTKWGSPGSGDGEFSYPYGVAVDPSGNIYVADYNNNRIQKFDANGGFVTKWGSPGSGDGEFYGPFGVAVDSSGNIYVADTNNHRIQKFDANGGFVTKWGAPGSGDGEFSNPYGVAVDSSGNIYVADFGNHRIQKFDANGGFVTKWGAPGTGDGEFYGPAGVAVDSSGNIYVADFGNHRIQKFDANGGFVTKWGAPGTGDGEFYEPVGIAVDSSGNVYVAEFSNHRIQKFRRLAREVGPSGYPYTSIQAAINAAASGDTVLVHDGTYLENINFLGKAITVKSVNGAASTIIDANGSGRGVTFNSQEGPGSVLDGFTIKNGNEGWGGGIYCVGSSPIISNCIISGNAASLAGGIGFDYSSATITNCIISGNTANSGGGIYSYYSFPTITNCTISGNTAANNGGGIGGDGSSPLVKNTILWGNTPDETYIIWGSITVTYSNVDQDGYAGSNGNIRQNPLFVDPANGNFRLMPTSPCIDAATSDGAPLADLAGKSRFDAPWIPNTGGGAHSHYDMGSLEYFTFPLEVGPSGYPYTSIQAAINAAASGDTVLVHDGTYLENINFLGKAITVKSVNGAARAIIDANGSGRGVSFNHNEGPGSVLDGFTLRNGIAPIYEGGGGIQCLNSSPTIKNCIIIGNQAYNGGGISCYTNSSPTITNCIISGNAGGWGGGGISCGYSSHPTITNCIIRGNSATRGGAISFDTSCSPTITNCTIVGNTSGDGGLWIDASSSPSVKNTILWGNTPNQIYFVDPQAGSINLAYSNVDQDGYAGANGNIRQNPLFVDAANGNFRLMPASPCVDAATSEDAPLTDLAGNPRFDAPWIPNTGGGVYSYYDMGALEYGQTSADFNGDGMLDLVWRNPTTGRTTIWYMDGATWNGGYADILPELAGTEWELVGIADFNNDSSPDLLWRNTITGRTTIWYMTGPVWNGGYADVEPTLSDMDWSIVGIADFNGDGSQDLLWRHGTSGRTTIWYMTGPVWNGGYADVEPTLSDPNWSIAGVADFNRDGSPDLLWRNSSAGRTTIWYMTGPTWNGGYAEVLPTLSDPNWSIAAVRDFNGDGSPDLLWRNTSADPGDPNQYRTTVWYMDGPIWNGNWGDLLPIVSDPNWIIVGR